MYLQLSLDLRGIRREGKEIHPQSDMLDNFHCSIGLLVIAVVVVVVYSGGNGGVVLF